MRSRRALALLLAFGLAACASEASSASRGVRSRDAAVPDESSAPENPNGEGSGLIDAPAPDTSLTCGNGQADPGEACDDGNKRGGDGCAADCRRVERGYACAGLGKPCIFVCGNGEFDAEEACDDGNTADGDGCSATCEVEKGWGCARPGELCVELPQCGNGVRDRGEQCDSGPERDPGCEACKIQPGYVCAVPGEACVEKRCGNGVRTPEEACDDGNTADGDGCSSRCTAEEGFRCSADGCRPICGDGRVLGHETCDDGNIRSGDGCSAGCGVEPGASCVTAGQPCGKASCGNQRLEGGEGCDDGNVIGGDGCGPTCQLEPQVSTGPEPTVHTRCGDGIVTNGEACDDGNTSSGDGCSETCVVEMGFTCKETLEDPRSVRMKVTYRDFKGRNEAGGHPHMSTGDLGLDLGIVGAVCNTTNAAYCGRLDADGKPQLAGFHGSIHKGNADHAAAFALWYRDGNPQAVEGERGTIVSSPRPAPVPAEGDFLTLTRDAAPGSYSFESSRFFPLNGRGFGNAFGQLNNYYFTTELRYFFQYKGGETLTFRGDDDVWVFINGRLAVDMGGIHLPANGRVVLGDDGVPGGGDSTCTRNGGGDLTGCAQSAAEAADDTDSRFGLEKGKVYEIVLFHAERQPLGSNFRLTLSGFLAPRSYCTPVCGDGIVAGWEVCDSGPDNVDGVYGVCNTTCSAMEYCGDNIRQSEHESCDNGENVDVVQVDGATNACAPGCVLPPRCGDGIVQAPYELCDNGADNADGAYNGCSTRCDWGPYCGDGKVDPGEECDEGPANVAAGGAGNCGYDCKPAYVLL